MVSAKSGMYGPDSRQRTRMLAALPLSRDHTGTLFHRPMDYLSFAMLACSFAIVLHYIIS